MDKIKFSITFFCCMLMVALNTYSNDFKGNKNFAPGADTGIVVPAGFNLQTVVSDLGEARHIVVAANGDVFVKLDKLKDGKGIYRLHDTNGDGKPDQVTGFGNYTGTGIAIKNGYLYASSNTEIYRYKIDEQSGVVDEKSVQKIVTGLW